MDALERSTALLIIAMLLFCPLMASDESEADSAMNGLMLYQVNPYECEGVAVHNYGTTIVNLEEYVIADMPELAGSEGAIQFNSKLLVEPGQTLVIVSERKVGNAFSSQDNTVEYGEKGVTSTSKFALSNSGDDVYLIKDGVIIDTVCYGNKTADDGDWTGSPVKVTKGKWIQRFGTTDTDSADDWRIFTAGQTAYGFDPELKFDAQVTPFLFPESGGIPIYEALESATESIRIEMYQLGSKNVLSLLCEKAADGVDVDILLEGESLDGGNDPIKSASGHLTRLIELGGEVRLIGMGENPRYAFDHAKFALIDGDTTIVTSENWSTANMNGFYDPNPYDSGTKGNRGWGAIIESGTYTDFMNGIFENDWSKDYGDVLDLLDEYPNFKAGDYRYDAPTETYPTVTYRASVTPVLSNDNSYDALEYYVTNAKVRAYSQQQSLESGFAALKDGTPITFFDTVGSKGVDSRLIFSSQISEDTVFGLNAKTAVKVASMDPPYVHNKGVICDDIVWVSSVNWTTNSLENNREVCAVIESKEIADFFAESFLSDFERYYTYEGFSAYFTEIEDTYESKSEVIFGVNVTPEGAYSYTWDLGDGSEPKTTDVPRIVSRPADGAHTLTVTITDSTGNVRILSHEYSVGDTSVPDTSSGEEGIELPAFIEEYLYIFIVIIALLLCIIGAASKKGSKKKRKSRK